MPSSIVLTAAPVQPKHQSPKLAFLIHHQEESRIRSKALETQGQEMLTYRRGPLGSNSGRPFSPISSELCYTCVGY